MKKLKILSLLTASAVAIALAGCSGGGDSSDEYSGKSKEELISMCKQWDEAYTNLNNQYNELSILYNGIQSEKSPTPAIGITGDGTGRFTFNSVDSKIIFPSSFQYPDSDQAVANGAINITSDVTATPGSNWVFKINNTTLELEHSNGISGTIKVGKSGFQYTSDELQTQVLSQWFQGLPPSDITYSKITCADSPTGCQAVTPTTIDSENAYLRCGMVAYNNVCITYVFVYRGEKDPNRDESIASVLNSITIQGCKLIVEQ